MVEVDRGPLGNGQIAEIPVVGIVLDQRDTVRSDGVDDGLGDRGLART